jgi:hypothetical protein
MWRFLARPFSRLSELLWATALSNRSDCSAVTCARDARMREASVPQTPGYPWRPWHATDPIRHALMAPGERRGGQPLLQIGPPCNPCLLASCPPPRRRAALPSRS